MASCGPISAPYDPSVYVSFLHQLPRFDSHFDVTNKPTFDPENLAYVDGLLGWAIVAAAFSVLLVIVSLLYLLCKCCCCSDTERLWLREPKVGGARCGLVFIALVAALVVAAIIYGGARTIADAKAVLDDAKTINADIEKAQDELESIGEKGRQVNADLGTLLGLLPTNDSETINLVNNALQTFSSVLGHVDSIQNQIDQYDLSSYVSDGKHYYENWIYVMTGLSVLLAFVVIFPCLVLLCCRTSTCCLKGSACFAVFGMLVCGLGSGLVIAATLSGSDLCSDPDEYFLNYTSDSANRDTVEYYVRCSTCSSPYSQSFVQAYEHVDTLNNIFRTLEGILRNDKMKSLLEQAESSLTQTNTFIASLNQTVSCNSISPAYYDARTSACVDAMYYLVVFLLALIAFAIPTTILVVCAENTWNKLEQANEYRLQNADERTPLRPRFSGSDRSLHSVTRENASEAFDRSMVTETFATNARTGDAEPSAPVTNSGDRDPVYFREEPEIDENVDESTVCLAVAMTADIVPPPPLVETRAEESFRCSVCLDVVRPPVKVHGACGRIVGCETCVQRIRETRRECPLCRGPIADDDDGAFITLRGFDDVLASYDNAS